RTGDGTSGRVYASQFSGVTLATATPITWTTAAPPALPSSVVRTHATISTDDRWGNDGTVEELYRYAVDVAKLDFVAQTDHEYSFMARQYNRMFLEADLYQSSRFTPMYGFEWTARKLGPVSHHNVISRVRHTY